jgi:hypothetical protein
LSIPQEATVGLFTNKIAAQGLVSVGSTSLILKFVEKYVLPYAKANWHVLRISKDALHNEIPIPRKRREGV